MPVGMTSGVSILRFEEDSSISVGTAEVPDCIRTHFAYSEAVFCLKGCKFATLGMTSRPALKEFVVPASFWTKAAVATEGIQIAINDNEEAHDRFSQVKREFPGPAEKRFAIRSVSPKHVIVGFEIDIKLAKSPAALLFNGQWFELANFPIQIPLRPSDVAADRQFPFLIQTTANATLDHVYVYVVPEKELCADPLVGRPGSLAEGIGLFDFLPGPPSHHPLSKIGRCVQKIDIANDAETFIDVVRGIYRNPFFSGACREIAVKSAAQDQQRATELWAQAIQQSVEENDVNEEAWSLLVRDARGMPTGLAQGILARVWAEHAAQISPLDRLIGAFLQE
jgi:hypothetical protein